MQIQTVAIIGLGALGTMYGKFFTDALGKERVRIVANKKRITRYQKEGIYCNGSLCDFQYVNCEENMAPADLVIFAVKYHQLEGAMKDAHNQIGENTIIISVLNGIVSEITLGDYFGKDKIIYCVAQGMDAMKEKNQLSYMNMGMLVIGEEGRKKSEKLSRLISFFENSKLPYEAVADIRHRLWGKLLCNTGVNQTVAVFKTTYSGIQKEGKARDVMIGAMREVIAVANKEGVALSEDDLDYWLRILGTLNPSGKPSLCQDTEAHRKTEVELFGGTIIDLGRKHRLATPYNDYLVAEIKKLENSYL